MMTTQTETSVRTMTDDDLQRLTEFAQIITSARDAMSDDMVSRLAGAMSEGLSLLDRLTRNDGLMHLLRTLDRQESQSLLVALSQAIHATSKDIAAAAPASGSLGDMLRIVRDPGTQEGIRFLAVLSRHLSRSLREQHQRDG